MNFDPTVGVFLDGLIAVLLLATIATGVFLNRRIASLRRSTKDINQLVGGFDKATARARAGIETLRNTLKESGEQLQDQINTARGLRDDLKQMAIAGGRLTMPEGREPARPAKPKQFAKAEPRGLPASTPRAEPPWAEPAQVMPLTGRMAEAAAAAEAKRPAVRRPQGANSAAGIPGQRPAAAAAGMTRKTAAAMAAQATESASEVERELRELLRHVR